jgi:glycosyltransferase involved in cell wall biosynthesis
MVSTGSSQAAAAHILAWGALAVLCYAYVGYPALLFLVGLAGRERRLQGPLFHPSVSVILAAWNEAAVMADKIENTLNQSYPSEKLELIVVSDGSTDATDEIVERYARETGRVKLLHTQGREGKSVALNIGVSAATGDVLVMTDANAIFEQDAVVRLVESLADAEVGAVSGVLRYRNAGLSDTESAYWRYEQRVKGLESRLGLLLGANGSIYAIRRELVPPLHPRDVNDFRVPYEALLRGYAVVLEPGAISSEPAAPSLFAEYRRKVRIMSRAIPMMIALVWTTLRHGRIVVLWQLISHKLLREVQGVFFVAMLLGASWGLMLDDVSLSAFAAGQAALYLLGALGWTVPAIGRFRPARLAAHFDMIVLASLMALGLCATGQVRSTWQPARPVGRME